MNTEKNTLDFEFEHIVFPSFDQKNESDYLKPVVITFLRISLENDSFVFPINKFKIYTMPYKVKKECTFTEHSILNDLKMLINYSFDDEYTNNLYHELYDNIINEFIFTINYFSSINYDKKSSGESFFVKIHKLFHYDNKNNSNYNFIENSFKNEINRIKSFSSDNKINFLLNNIEYNINDLINHFEQNSITKLEQGNNLILKKYQNKETIIDKDKIEILNYFILTIFIEYVHNKKINHEIEYDDLFFTHYSNLSNAVYSDIIKHENFYPILAKEIKEKNYSGLVLLNSLTNLDVQEINILNKDSKNIGIHFLSNHFINLSKEEHFNFSNEIKNSVINNIVFRGTEPKSIKFLFLNYSPNYIKSFFFDKILPKFSYAKKFKEQFIKLIKKDNDTVIAGHSYGARNAQILQEELSNENINTKGLLLSLPFAKFHSKEEIMENYDGKIYAKNNNSFFSYHKNDPVTFTYLLLFSILSLILSGLFNYLNFKNFFYIFLGFGVFSVCKLLWNFKFHKSGWLRNHTSFFLHFKNTLMGKYSYNNNILDILFTIEKIFSTLDGNIPEYNMISSHIDHSLPKFGKFNFDEEDNQKFNLAIQNLKNKNINPIDLFNKCLIQNHGTNFDSFFIPEVCEVVKFYHYADDLKKELESFFSKVNNIKFNFVN